MSGITAEVSADNVPRPTLILVAWQPKQPKHRYKRATQIDQCPLPQRLPQFNVVAK